MPVGFEFLTAKEVPEKVEALARRYPNVKIAVAYMKDEGFKSVQDCLHLNSALSLKKSNHRIKLLVGLAHYYITDPKPLKRLLQVRKKLEDENLADRLELRYYGSTAFHPKVFVFERNESIAAIVGSSNMTGGGTGSNTEANISFEVPVNSDIARKVVSFFDSIWSIDKQSGPEILTFEKLAIYSHNKRRFDHARDRTSERGEEFPGGRLKASSGGSGQDGNRGLETVGWVLNHQVGEPHGSDTPEDFVEELRESYRTDRLWHWTAKAAFAEGGPYLLILARDMEIYGHAVAFITQDIERNRKDEGYVFAFRFASLYLLEKHGKHRIPLRDVIPITKLRNFYSLVKLSTHPWITKNYEKVAKEKFPSLEDF